MLRLISSKQLSQITLFDPADSTRTLLCANRRTFTGAGERTQKRTDSRWLLSGQLLIDAGDMSVAGAAYSGPGMPYCCFVETLLDCVVENFVRQVKSFQYEIVL